jgi:hypothetical protein
MISPDKGFADMMNTTQRADFFHLLSGIGGASARAGSAQNE